jgi:hypothetical protein
MVVLRNCLILAAIDIHESSNLEKKFRPKTQSSIETYKRFMQMPLQEDPKLTGTEEFNLNQLKITRFHERLIFIAER